jgi:hypothetical protein
MLEGPHNVAPSQEVPQKYRIMVSVGERRGHDVEHSEREVHSDLIKKLDADPVQWGAKTEVLNEREQKNAGSGSYVISKVDEENKYSEAYGPCTGIAVVGTEKVGGKNISLLTHQAPHSIDEDFIKALTEELAQLKSLSKLGTIDVLMYGGTVVTHKTIFGRTKTEDAYYNQIIEKLNTAIKDALGVEPRIFGANTTGFTNVVLDTENRRLHMERAEGDAFGDFDKPASEALKEKKK